MIKRRPRKKLISDINVVPYIDVMLVLLVIFMISAPLMVQGVLINLPEASSKNLPRQVEDPLIISVKLNGEYYLETESTLNKPLNLDQLSSKLEKILKTNPSQQLVVRGDGKVRYEVVINMMSELQALGAKEIGLITKPHDIKK
tara:strand:+ start:108 stop:539 length:432 start_codon:yes stop_codon:yes gene_type:complete